MKSKHTVTENYQFTNEDYTRGKKKQENYKEEKYKMALESPYLLRDINNHFIRCKWINSQSNHFKDTHRLNMKKWEKIFQPSGN